MESSTNIKKIFAGNKILIPNYQRAYSWETDRYASSKPKQVDTFLNDLEEYNASNTQSNYYFGHFLFEQKADNTYGVIDGQQRLTTIVIFLSALFLRLKELRRLSTSEIELFEDMIKRNETYRFATVDYDNQLFRDYVVDQTKKDKNGIDTTSAHRIAEAFDYFVERLSEKDETYLLQMLKTIQEASCTTHRVADESEAIQMFIFQNNRGKKPSNLEIIKAQFMFKIHLLAGQEKDTLIDEIKNRFEKIYRSISSIEYNIREDDVLLYTLRVYFNSLWEENAIEKINRKLSEDDALSFIRNFTQELTNSFEYLRLFFGEDEKKYFAVHSLVTLGGLAVSLPFILKAYKFDIPKTELEKLCTSLESLVLRHRVIGTRADITSRINHVYTQFSIDNPSILPITEVIEYIKQPQSDEYWWSFWTNEKLRDSLQGPIHHATAKFLLWKYELYLEANSSKGYTPRRYDTIVKAELEHIAPQTENPEKGYENYTDKFRQESLHCLGNYLLVSKPHNSSVGNRPFAEKLATYTYLYQQREIQEMTQDSPKWTKEHIQDRKEKIIDFLIKSL